jgi:hypothetical protein
VPIVMFVAQQGKWVWYLSPCNEATPPAIESPGC